MLNAQALNTLAALQRYAAASSSVGAPASSPTGPPGLASVSQQLQAAAQAQQQQDAQNQAQVHTQAPHQAAPLTVTPEMLQAMLGLNGNLSPPIAGLSSASQPSPSPEARALAAKIFMAHQQQQQQQQQAAAVVTAGPAKKQRLTDLERRPSEAPSPPMNKAVTNSRQSPPVSINKQGHTGEATDKLESAQSEWEQKKEAKRAANRRLALLSRKRKKMELEELKEENEVLRREQLILQSIPDLVLAFGPCGGMPFVSNSVEHFLDFTSDELQDTSFWDRLTEDSAQLVKSAFIDALAVRRSADDDATPLFDGESMLIKLVDKDGKSTKLASMKGVVHFSGEVPECVCSIRNKEHAAAAASASAADANTSAPPAGEGNNRKNWSPYMSSLSVSSSSSEASSSGRRNENNDAALSHRISDDDKTR